MKDAFDLNNTEIPKHVGGNYYRSDDVSATAYFYLDRPENNLPKLPSVDIRMKFIKERVLAKVTDENR